MKYFRVIKEKYDYFNKNTTVMNELLTPRERNTKFRYLSDNNFSVVEVSKSVLFGALERVMNAQEFNNSLCR